MQNNYDNYAVVAGDSTPKRESAVQAWLKVAVLFGLGIYFLYNILSGNLANYINYRFGWLSWVAAALFLLLGCASLYDLLRRDGEGKQAVGLSGVHRRVTWPLLLVGAFPLVIGVAVPSQPLSADAVAGSISTNAVTAGSATLIQRDPMQRNVLDWLRAFNNSTDMSEFNGQAADVVGFLYTEPNLPADTFMIARFTVSCCVADAAAIGLPVVWEGTGEIEANTWLRVTGTFQLGEFRGDDVPILHAATVEIVDQPEHPYLYP